MAFWFCIVLCCQWMHAIVGTVMKVILLTFVAFEYAVGQRFILYFVDFQIILKKSTLKSKRLQKYSDLLHVRYIPP